MNEIQVSLVASANRHTLQNRLKIQGEKKKMKKYEKKT